MEHGDIVVDDRRFTDYHAGRMIDQDSLADSGLSTAVGPVLA
jgi:hypothetical protein